MKTATPVVMAAHSSIQQLLRHATRTALLCGCLGACSQLPRPADHATPATPTATAAQQKEPAAAKGQKPPPATRPGAPPSTPSAPPAATPGAAPPQTAPSAATLRIDSAQSLIAITVRRGGMLARLGHDHLVASH